MANLRIDIASEFTGKPAFSKAGKATDVLGKQVKKMGLAAAAAFSTQSVVAFGKASIQAFMEAEKANTRLATVVKNLGLGFETANIQASLDEISAKTGIAGEVLAEAYQPLISATGSAITSQKLLQSALDISAGSGVDVAQVAADLSQAYVGNTKAMKKYGLGLTNAELKAASFEEIMAKLNGQFKGSQAKYLETYAGKMGVLQEAAGAAQERIGEALVDAFAAFIEEAGGVDGIVEKIDELTSGVVGLIEAMSMLFDTWKNLKNAIPEPLAKILDQINKIMSPINHFIDALKFLGQWSDSNDSTKKAAGLAPASANQHLTSLGGQIDDKKRAAAEAAAKKRAAELAKLQKENTKELKKATLEKKQQGLFDLQQIQLVAALKGQLSDQDRDRIKLQLALLQGNESEAARLTAKIANSIDATGKLAEYLRTLPDAKNPFAGWKGYLDEVELQAKRIAAFSVTAQSGGTPSTNLVPLPPSFKPTMPMPPRVEGGPTVIKVEIDGKEVATAVQNQNNSGNKTGFSRLGDFLTL
jgi:hypothetical protein